MTRQRSPGATAVLALLLGVLSTVVGCGGDDDDRGSPSPEGTPPVVSDPGPVHVHGLGENPKDGALFIATHTGLFRLASPDGKAERIADRYQDTMGFTVAGPDRFLGSGHPDGREGLPPFLGLIESSDAGETWRPISLQGAADFHVLEARDDHVYGYGSDFDTRQELFLVSADGGHTWRERSAPEPLLALAIDPEDPRKAVAAGERGIHVTVDAGRSWRPLGEPVAGLSWPKKDRLYSVDAQGEVRVSEDGGQGWSLRGHADGEPAAFEAAGPNELYVALHDGRIKRSSDGGRSWALHYRPG